MEVYFLFKKIIVLTTSLAISLFGINEFCAQASVLNNTTQKVVNVSYLEKNNINLNNNVYEYNNDINTANTSSVASIDFLTQVENIINDMTIYNKNLEEQKAEEAKLKENQEKQATTSQALDNTEYIASMDTNTTNNEIANYKASYTMVSTAYTGDTITYTGTTPVRDPNGISTIAVDPSIIPLGSKVYIPGYGMAIAADTGGAIKGNKIDLFLNSEDDCINWGVQNVSLYIIAYPGEL